MFLTLGALGGHKTLGRHWRRSSSLLVAHFSQKKPGQRKTRPPQIPRRPTEHDWEDDCTNDLQTNVSQVEMPEGHGGDTVEEISSGKRGSHEGWTDSNSRQRGSGSLIMKDTKPNVFAGYSIILPQRPCVQPPRDIMIHRSMRMRSQKRQNIGIACWQIGQLLMQSGMPRWGFHKGMCE